MPPDIAKAGPRHRDRPASSMLTSTSTKLPQPGTTVMAIAYAPAGRRTRWLAIVEHCPHCGHAHAHRWPPHQAPVGDTTAGCRRGAYYLVLGIRPAVTR